MPTVTITASISGVATNKAAAIATALTKLQTAGYAVRYVIVDDDDHAPCRFCGRTNTLRDKATSEPIFVASEWTGHIVRDDQCGVEYVL